MPTLAASLATNEHARTSPVYASTLTAQAFGWGGDVGLLGKGAGPFMLGAGSFGAGHLAYVSGFRRVRREDRLRDSPRARLLVAAAAAMAPVLAVGAARKEPALGVAVPAYVTLLTTMATHGTHLHPGQPGTARALTAAGALSFLASDSILGVREFLASDPPAWMERTVMATYTSAQFLLAEGATRMR